MDVIKKFLNNTLGKVFKNVAWLEIPASVYVRYLLAFIAAINAILNAFNINPINLDETKLYDVISAILFIVILFVNTYKDNPVSPEAIESNKYFQALKAKKKKMLENGVLMENTNTFTPTDE